MTPQVTSQRSKESKYFVYTGRTYHSSLLQAREVEELNKEMKHELKKEIDKLETEIDENGKVENGNNCESVLLDAYESLRKSQKLRSQYY